MAAPSDIRRLLNSPNIDIDYNSPKDDIVGLSSQLGLCFLVRGRFPSRSPEAFGSNPTPTTNTKIRGAIMLPLNIDKILPDFS
jgi:hypothetical protein